MRNKQIINTIKNKQSIDNLRDKILKNAALLNVSDLKISDRVKLDASMLPADQVIALYKSQDQGKSGKCKSYEAMPYKPLPKAVIYEITISGYS